MALGGTIRGRKTTLRLPVEADLETYNRWMADMRRAGVEIRADNAAGLRIADRLGYAEYARGHEVHYRDGAYVDEIQLLMSKETWYERWGATEREYPPIAADATR